MSQVDIVRACTMHIQLSNDIYVKTVHQDVVYCVRCLSEHSHLPSECFVKSTVNCKRICTEQTLSNSPSKP